MSGVKGKSGRKKDPKGATKYFNELYDENAFNLAEITIQKALAGDKELLIYCHDRRLGKPKLHTDITIDSDLALNLQVHHILTQLDSPKLLEGDDAT